jgi:hypothetical protein
MKVVAGLKYVKMVGVCEHGFHEGREYLEQASQTMKYFKKYSTPWS